MRLPSIPLLITTLGLATISLWGCGNSGDDSSSGAQDLSGNAGASTSSSGAPATSGASSTGGTPPAAGDPSSDSPITLENWAEHPKVLATRAAIADVLDQTIELTDQTKNLCSSANVQIRMLSKDGSQRIRRYSDSKTVAAGADEFVYTYDQKGLLRAVQRFQSPGPEKPAVGACYCSINV
jgi:hypothetical protein